jgi:small subunit ribosomal protein S14
VKKRKKLVIKYSEKRSEILNELKTVDSLEEIFELNEKFKNFPVTVLPLRLRNRCWKTGRPRGYFQDYFGLCRNAVRELST